jgi:hypothetical protein
VALEATFDDLVSQLRQLRDTLQGLRLTAVEDRPKGEAVMLIDQMGDASEEVLGRLQEALSHAENAQHAVGPTIDLNGARRSLTASQEQFHELAHSFYEDFLSYERVEALLELPQKREHGWLAWTESARRGVDSCRSAINATGYAYFHCWQEIAERVGTNLVSVQTTSVGQQIGRSQA